MSLAVDLILVVLMIAIVITGIKRGFVKSFMKLVSIAVSLFVAYWLTPGVSSYISEKFIKGPVSDKIAEGIKSVTKDISKEGIYNITKLFGGEAPAVAGVDTSKIDSAYSGITDGTEQTVNSISDSLSEPVANVISSVIAFILIFIVAMLACWLVTLIIDAVFKLPVLSAANRLLGGVFGALAAVFTAWILTKLIVALVAALAYTGSTVFSQAMIDNSVVLKYFAQNNPFGDILSFTANILS